jgi:polyribonucleotide nucleotidyltransferase
MPFGAFVNLTPGKMDLCASRTSQQVHGKSGGRRQHRRRNTRARDEIDKQGKINLTRKGLLPEDQK